MDAIESKMVLQTAWYLWCIAASVIKFQAARIPNVEVAMATRPRLLELVLLMCLSAGTTARLARSQS